MAEPLVATYSIAACDLEAAQWGVATQSKFPAVGSIVPWAEPGVGAIATQALANPRYGPHGLALLRERLSAADVVARLTEADDGRDDRQLGIVDASGNGATYTGSGCLEWAGGLAGPGFAAAGENPGGGRARRPGLRRAGEHPRRGRDRRRARHHLHGNRRATARRAAARVPRRRA